jgi:hypothetical protein
MTRRLLGFAEPFDSHYVSKLIQVDYWPPIDILIDDYIDANPSRDRDLDLLPLFAYLNENQVRGRLPNEKISARPTYHYRLPDARVDDPEWSLALEWNRWVAVENLAANPEKLLSACQAYLKSGANRDSWLPGARELAGR